MPHLLRRILRPISLPQNSPISYTLPTAPGFSQAQAFACHPSHNQSSKEATTQSGQSQVWRAPFWLQSPATMMAHHTMAISTMAIFGVLAVVLSSLLVGCRNNEGALLPPLEVTVSQPVRQTITDFFYATGNFQATETVQLTARVSGFLREVHFTDGSYVKQGSPLFVIEPEPFAAKVSLAQSAVEAAKAEFLRARLEFERQEDLVKKRAASLSDFEKWRAQRDSAQAKLSSASAELELALLDQGYARITAPFDGFIDRKLVDVGNLVGVGQPTLLATIRRLDPIHFYFNVGENDLVAIRRKLAGRDARELRVFLQLKGEDGFEHKGKLDFNDVTVDNQTGTIAARAIIDNPPLTRLPLMLSGMYGRVRVPLQEIPDALLLPESCIGTTQTERFVYVVGDNDIVSQVAVTLGPSWNDQRVITKGLNGGEKVVVKGFQRLRPGMKVKTV